MPAENRTFFWTKFDVKKLENRNPKIFGSIFSPIKVRQYLVQVTQN